MANVDIILAPDPEELDPDIREIDSDIADLTDLREQPAVLKKSDRSSVGAHVLKLADVSDENQTLDLVDSGAPGYSKKRTKLLSARYARFAARLIDLCWEGAITTLAVGTLLVNTMGAPTSLLVYYLLFLIVLPATLLLDTVVQAVFGNTPGKLLFGLKAVTWRGAKIGFRAALSRNFLLWRSGFACGFLPLIPFTLASQFKHVGKGSRSSYDTRQHLRVRYQPPPLLAQIVIVFGVLAIILTPIYRSNTHTKFFNTIADFDLSRVSLSSDNGEIVYLEPEPPLNPDAEPVVLAAQSPASSVQDGISVPLTTTENTKSTVSKLTEVPVDNSTTSLNSAATEYNAATGAAVDISETPVNQVTQGNITTETTAIAANEATADTGTTTYRVVTAEEPVTSADIASNSTLSDATSAASETSATPEEIVLDAVAVESETTTDSTIEPGIVPRESSIENSSEEGSKYNTLEQMASIKSDLIDSSAAADVASTSNVETTLAESSSLISTAEKESSSNIVTENNSTTPQNKIEEALTGDPEISILTPVLTDTAPHTETATQPWTNPFSGFSTEIDSVWKMDISDLEKTNTVTFRNDRENFQISLSRETNDLALDLPDLAESFQAQYNDKIAFSSNGRDIMYDGKRVRELSGKQSDDSDQNFRAQLYLNDNDAYFLVVEDSTNDSALRADGEQLVTIIWRTIE